MSVIHSIFNAGALVINTAAKLVLVTARVAVVRTVTTTAAVAATVVDEAQLAARELQSDRNIKASIDASKSGYTAVMAYSRNKASAIEAAACDFANKHQ